VLSRDGAGPSAGIAAGRGAATLARSTIAAILVIAIGVLMAVAFLIAAGVDYRRAEESGIEPGPTPEWLVQGVYAGALLAVLGVVLIVVVALVRIGVRRKPARRPHRGEAKAVRGEAER